MKDNFKEWLIRNNYSESTSNSYVSAINTISKDLSEKMKSEVNVYMVDNLYIIAKLSELYDKTGGFAELGDKGNGTIRNAIRRYFEFAMEK